MDFDIVPTLLFCLVITVPAFVIFIILRVIRIRRGKFHRQRIGKRSGNTQGEGTPK